MTYKVEFLQESLKELEELDGSLKLFILKQIKKLSENPELGEPLGNKAGIDLTGFRKIYVFKKKIRIVYKIIEDRIEIIIVSINKREKFKVYEISEKRINNL